MKTNPTTRLAGALRRCGVPALAVLLTLDLTAQTAPPPPATPPAGEDQPVQLQEFTVTGSNIRRVEQETPLPVTVIDVDDLDLRAASTPVELFEYLPQAGELPISEEGTLGASARGDVASISLRSVGSSNTLTLVNGRRMVPHPISQAESGVPSLAVNINSLPGAAIGRIEVLRDGASAIYGADAAAGVVNAILEEDPDGTRLTLRGSFTEDGGAAERRATLSHGSLLNGGRTKVRFSIDYFHRDVLMARDRTFAADSDMRSLLPAPWNGFLMTLPSGGTLRDNDYDNRSSTSNYGHFIRGAFSTGPTGDVQFVGSRPDGNRGITTSTTPSTTLTARGTTVPGEFFLTPLAEGGTGFRQTTPSRNVEGVERNFYYNLNQDRHMLPATDRFNVVGVFEHRLGEHLRLFGDAMFYLAESRLYRDPAGIDATDDPNIFIPKENYWNPFGVRFYHPTGAPNADGSLRVQGNPADVLIAGGTGVRPREFKAKEVDVESIALRGVVGLRGPLFGDWEWESAMMYGWARTEDVEHWNIRESRLREALARTDATAFNPFGYNFVVVPNPSSTTNPRLVQIGAAYTNPAAVVDPLYDDFVRVGKTSIASWDARASGPVVKLWERQLRGAAGLEFRHETYEDTRPPFHGLNPAGSSATNPYLREGDNDFIGLSPNIDLSADRNVFAGYTELLVPVFAPKHRVPGFRALEFSAAVRYEEFSDFGETLKPKYSVGWRPNGWIMVRGSYNESFRAPNLVQTNTSPLQRSVTGVSDPYRFEVTGNIFDGARSRTVFRQGNDQLEPEEAENVAVGFVIDLPFAPGLSISADYWKLDQTSVIANVSATGQLQRDRDLLDAATQAQLAAGTPIGSVVVQSASIYLGNPKVRRAAVTQADIDAFAAYNAGLPPAQQRAPVGQVISVIDDYLNLAGRALEGVDFSAQYRLPRSRLGQFTFRAEGTWLRKFEEQADATSIIEDNLNENGISRLRGNASVTWRKDAWTAGWLVTYTKGTVDTGAAVGLASTDPALINEVLTLLGNPRYIQPFSDSSGNLRYGYLVDDWISHNAYVNYRFPRKSHEWLRGLSVRLGVNNVFGEDPPIADESRGYRTGGANPRGRQYYAQLTKQF